MAIKVATLKTFVVVADSGNIVDAADILGRTPSAVSMTLRQLEEHLGKPLFEADRKSRLTPLGRLVLAEARREVEHFERSLRLIEGYARNEIGHVDVACVPSVSARILPPLLEAFLARWPGLGIDIRDMDSLSVCRALQQGQVEVGIASMTGRRADLNATPLLRDRFGVVCNEAHPLTRLGRPVTWDDLEGHSLVGNNICRLIEDPALARLLDRARLLVRNTTSILAVVRAGVGVSILPRLAVPEAAEGLRHLPLADPHALRELQLIVRSTTTLSPAAEVFVEMLRAGVAAFGAAAGAPSGPGSGPDGAEVPLVEVAPG